MRHGENNHLVKNKDIAYFWPEVTPIKLTKKGQKDVKNSVKKIKKAGIDLIYSSDILRAKETAKIAAKELGIKKIIYDKRLRDINMGVYQGRAKKDFCEFMGYKKRKFSKNPPRGESWVDVKKRVKNFIKKVDKTYKGKNILIVGHGDPLWLLEGVVKGKTNRQLINEVFKKEKYIGIAELRKIN